MEIIYKAEDGTVFDNEFACLEYEKKGSYNHIYSIEWFTKIGNKYFVTKDNLFEDRNYNICEKIRIHNEDEFTEFLDLANYCGWCEFYEQIKEPGTWMRIETSSPFEGKWIKIAAI